MDEGMTRRRQYGTLSGFFTTMLLAEQHGYEKAGFFRLT